MNALGGLAILGVSLALLATIAVQIRTPGGRWLTLELLAITPQWKFFAISPLAEVVHPLADLHLVVRNRGEDGTLGPWQPVLSPEERRFAEAFWNPGRRLRTLLLGHADDLANDARLAGHERVQETRAYLVLLRHCLDALPRGSAVCRQFAVIRTCGRGKRPLSVAFVSGFHRW